MNSLWITTWLLAGVFVSALATEDRKLEKRKAKCHPWKKDKVMVLPGPITDYAMIENAFVYDLHAVSICMIALWNPSHVEPSDNQCVFSYAVPGTDNELTLFSYPTSHVLIHGQRRDIDQDIPSDDLFHHFCFTWSNTNGDYQFWIDGEVVGSGSGLNKGGRIEKGGTLVIGQDQDKVGGAFDPRQSWIGEVSGINVWGVVLSESDIVAQYHHCHVTLGSVVMWPKLYAKESLHGNVEVYP